jgi:hypothetical protein
VAIEAVLNLKCETCGAAIVVPYCWNQGVIVPKPSQVRVQLLEWSEENHELIDVKLQPDVSCLLLCENCRAELLAEIIAAVLRLRDKQPEEKPKEVVN